MIELRKISILDENVQECIELEVLPEQTRFVGHNASSLGSAYAANSVRGLGSRAMPYAIYAGGKMVGFIMYAFLKPEYDDEYGIGSDYYYFWRFMIDKNHQGKGYGKAALEELIKEIKSKPCGDAEYLIVSYVPDNSIKNLYFSFGFEETGDVVDGEAVAKLKL